MKDKTKNRETGDLGEDIACMFLMKHSFEILERNYWKKFGELDIIATKGNKLHFIEVKSVSCVTFPDRGEIDTHRPEDNVHPAKLARLARTIQTYLIEKDVSDETNWQFDLVTVYINTKDKTAKVEMLEDIVIS
jgi:putative endonuclease